MYSAEITLWYKTRVEWKTAERTKEGFRISAACFDYTTSPAIPVMKGLGILAFTEDGRIPEDIDCREFNVRI